MTTPPALRPPFKVLIVDDDASIRALLSEVVTRTGGTPILTASGVEGYATLAAAPSEIALILLDLAMPEMDGFRFREMQLEDPSLAAIPVIVLTGFSLTSDEVAFMRAAAVLTKPAPVLEIRDAILRHAQRVTP